MLLTELKKDYTKKVYVPLLEHYQEKVSLEVHGQVILTVFRDSFCIPFQNVQGANGHFQIGSYHVRLARSFLCAGQVLSLKSSLS